MLVLLALHVGAIADMTTGVRLTSRVSILASYSSFVCASGALCVLQMLRAVLVLRALYRR